MSLPTRRDLALLWGLSRPRGLVWIALVPALGFTWAHWDRALPLRHLDLLLPLVPAWALIHAGTMWLNASMDRDEGAVLFGRPLPVPPCLSSAGVLALGLAVALAALSGPVPVACALGCSALAIAYSHPRIHLKAHPVLGPLTNVLGYCALSPLAGWAVVDVPVDARTLVTWALSVPWILGCYFAAQTFQQREDAARGYRTLVVTHGPATTLWVARTLLRAGALGVLVLVVLGWYPRAILLALLLFPLPDRWMATVPGDGDGAWAEGLVRRLLVYSVALVLCVVGQHLVHDQLGQPVAGLGTAAGHPPDPLTSPGGREARPGSAQAAAWHRPGTRSSP